MQKMNEEGLELIKTFEGCRLKAYQDLVGIWTIGYGHVGEVAKPGAQIYQSVAEVLLQEDVAKFEKGVDKLVEVYLTSNQFSALVCFAYNVGLSNLKKSTLLKHVNNEEMNDAANEFLRWCKADGKRVQGLYNRRLAERALFMA